MLFNSAGLFIYMFGYFIYLVQFVTYLNCFKSNIYSQTQNKQLGDFILNHVEVHLTLIPISSVFPVFFNIQSQSLG